MAEAHPFERRPIDELYRWFAGETAATSPVWERLCHWIAEHPEVNGRLDALPGAKRQPNVFLGALKFLGGPLEPGPGFAAWVDAHWADLERVILSRATQTNEPGRCAVFAPLLAALPQPVTLLELGSSAGLCLLPDRYRYRYLAGGPDAAAGVPRADPSSTGLRSEGEVSQADAGAGVSRAAVLAPAAATPDAPVLDSAVTGDAPGDVRALRIAARCGLDRNPLDPADAGDAAWLRALVWPGEDVREARLAACLERAASDPPPILTGDIRTDLDALLAHVAPGSTPVLQHSAVLSYLTRSDRDAVVEAVRATGVHWISYEGPSVLTHLRGRLPGGDAWREIPHFVVALDGEPVARASAHGGWVRWGL